MRSSDPFLSDGPLLKPEEERIKEHGKHQDF
jgi:hypothetical protein